MATVSAVHIMMVKDRELEYKALRASDQAAELAHQLIKQNDREHLIVLSMNSSNKPVNINIVHVGTANSAAACPREILKPAILSNAVSIIVLHNHPSGDTTPSKADQVFTENLHEACQIMQIQLLDSIIISEPGKPHYSFADEGLILEVGQ